MAILPSVDSAFPQLKQLSNPECDRSITIPTEAARQLLSHLLSSWPFDENWYVTTYPDIADAIKSGKLTSAREHYIRYGYLEGRLPFKPEFDASWYSRRYPDIAAGIASGKIKSAFEHYLSHGYREGRVPCDAKPTSMGLTSATKRRLGLFRESALAD